ncbi:MAG: acetylornithine/succinylornithine family transaminase [Ruminococcaceae bacterium]|nr:acetylornithine/succinylornithine family transaminase [Oscillospiraceae bacterium]
MDRNTVIQNDNEFIMHTYGRLPLVPDHASGASIWDKDGKKYIDFTSGIGVNVLGYSDAGWAQAVFEQASRYQHVCNYYYCEPASALAEWLVKTTGLENVFFGNSGAEANEGAIKLARKYSFDKYGAGRNTIITLNKSFHGRTVTTLAATGQDVFHQYFFPFTEGFKYCDAGDPDALKEACTDDVCAVMLEVIQGEGGVNILDKEYVRFVAALCEEKDILLIVDEVQTGIGRTGKAFGFQNYDILPDIVTSAKGLAGGLPIGAFISGKKASATLGASAHGSTFGANPVAAAAACYVTGKLTDEFLQSVENKGKLIEEKILGAGLENVVSVRRMGMMIGIQIKDAPKERLLKAFEMGLLVLTAGKDVVRLLPPLNISMNELDEGISLLIEALS